MTTFANLPSCSDTDEIMPDMVVLLGMPYGTTYNPAAAVHSRNAPEAIRKESVRYPDDPIAWDFDLGRPLLESRIKIVDYGNLSGNLQESEQNRAAARNLIRNILEKGAIPVVLGGDDSIPIPVLEAYQKEPPFIILQIDAHIDWRDEVQGEKFGYSSTMRRASEMSYVTKIIQVGMRGVGSARKEEFDQAGQFGAKIITSGEFKESGFDAVLSHIPQGARCFITIDFDALDPSEMPAVAGPTPGGLTYLELIRIIHEVGQKTELIGVCLVELVPECDINQLGTITAMRVVWNVLGALQDNLRKHNSAQKA